MSKYDHMTTEELSVYYYEYNKDVHGFKDINYDPTNREQLIKSIESIDNYMDSMKTTVEGRNELRSNGWIIKEPSAEEDGWVDPWANHDFNPY